MLPQADPFLRAENDALTKHNTALFIENGELKEKLFRLNADIEKLVGYSPAYRENLRATYAGNLDKLRADLVAFEHASNNKRAEIESEITASLSALTNLQEREAKTREIADKVQAVLDATTSGLSSHLAIALAEADALKQKNMTIETWAKKIGQDVVLKMVVSALAGAGLTLLGIAFTWFWPLVAS